MLAALYQRREEGVHDEVRINGSPDVHGVAEYSEIYRTVPAAHVGILALKFGETGAEFPAAADSSICRQKPVASRSSVIAVAVVDDVVDHYPEEQHQHSVRQRKAVQHRF